MNRSELVDAIAARIEMSKSDVDATLRGLFEVVEGVVAKGGDRVTIPGFISFEQGAHAARNRDPIKVRAVKAPRARKTVAVGAAVSLPSETERPSYDVGSDWSIRPDATHVVGAERVDEELRADAASAATWADAFGGFYDAADVARLLGTSRRGLALRKDLLLLRTGAGRPVYPAFQFQGRTPLPGLRAVLDALPERLLSRWTLAGWLVTPAPELGGERPTDALRAGASTRVMSAVLSWAEALRQ